jgi:hypothetical protein
VNASDSRRRRHGFRSRCLLPWCGRLARLDIDQANQLARIGVLRQQIVSEQTKLGSIANCGTSESMLMNQPDGKRSCSHAPEDGPDCSALALGRSALVGQQAGIAEINVVVAHGDADALGMA